MSLLNVNKTINTNINTFSFGSLTSGYTNNVYPYNFSAGIGLFNFDKSYTNPYKSFGNYFIRDTKSIRLSGNKVNNKPSLDLKNVGYNPSKGQKLANIAKQNATGFKKLCATYVKKDIEQAGLGKYEYGHAYQCDDILDRNPNFKEISTKGLDLTALPAGCVLVYDRGVARYSKQYGHIEITDGNGNAFSDGKTKHIKPGAKVYVPVSRNYMA